LRSHLRHPRRATSPRGPRSAERRKFEHARAHPPWQPRCVDALARGAGVVKIVRGAGIELDFYVTAFGAALFNQGCAAFRRYFLIGIALEEKNRRVRAISGFLERALEFARRIEGERGAKSARARMQIGADDIGGYDSHRGERGAAAVRPPLQADAIGNDIAARTQISQAAVRVERPHGDLVNLAGALIVAKARKPLRISARPKSIDKYRYITEGRPKLAPHAVTPRQRRSIVTAIRSTRISARSAVHHNHGRRAARIAARGEDVADKRGAAVEARKRNVFRRHLLRPGAGPRHYDNSRGSDAGRKSEAFAHERRVTP
jgi:hypothetical protein